MLDVLLEMKGLSPESGDILGETEESFFPANDDSSLKAVFEERSADAQSTTSTTNKQQTLIDKKETSKFNKQVSWSDNKDAKNESSDSDDENSEEDESSQKSETVCEKGFLEASHCKCDSGVALNDYFMAKEKDVKTGDEDGLEGKEKVDEPRKFDGVFSDTDDSEGSDERYKRELNTYLEISFVTFLRGQPTFILRKMVN